MPLVVNGVQVDINAMNNASPVIKQVASDVQGLETSARDAGDGIAETSNQMGGLTLSASNLNVAVGIVTTGIGAMVAAFKAGEIASANERLIDSGQELAAVYGGSMDLIVKKVSEASLGTVSELDIIRAANRAMMLGVSADAEQLATLMEIAAFRARAMGISTTQAFDDMIAGIGRGSYEILDNLGIVISMKDTYDDYAKSIGKSSDTLSKQEKTQAILNSVLEEGNELLSETGGLVVDNAAHYERWNAELENTQGYLLENAIGMSRFADMGADALVVFRDLADNGIGYGADRLNLFSLAMGLATERVEKDNEVYELANQIKKENIQLSWEQVVSLAENTLAARDADAARWSGLASMYETITATEELAGVTQTLVEVDEDAVKGAIKVKEEYDKQSEKLADLQLDHQELLNKKQELMDQGWGPESEKIQNVNDKLADNEQKQNDVTVAMQGTLQQMLLNTAAAGLDAEAQLALARATGQIDEETYIAMTALANLKKQQEDGTITADEYAKKVVDLRGVIASLQSKDITITVNTITNELLRTQYGYAGFNQAELDGIGKADGGPVSAGKLYEVNERGVPELLGFAGRQFLMMPNSGDGYVTPLTSGRSNAGGGMGGGSQIVFAPTIQNMFGNENDMMDSLYGAFTKMLEKAKADGHLNG